MRYPIVPMDSCVDVAADFVANGWRRMTPDEYALSGRAPDLDLRALDEAAREINRRCEDADATSKDAIEGEAGAILHRAVHHLPAQVLDDPQFWRYVSLGLLWPFISWRESDAFATHAPSKYLPLIDARSVRTTVATRMYLRAAACKVDDDYRLAYAVDQSAGFWHLLLRSPLMHNPVMIRAVVSSHINQRMTTEQLQELLHRLHRDTSNMITALLDNDRAHTLVTDARQSAGV